MDMDFDTFKTPTSYYNHSNHVFRIKNDTRSPPLSGTSVFSNDSIKVTLISKSSDHEIINCKVSNDSEKINLIYAYLSPSSNKAQVLNFYKQVITLTNKTQKSERVLIIGDLNAKNNNIYPTTSPCYSGEILAKILNGEQDSNLPSCKRQLTNLVKYPTRRQGSTKTC